MSLDSHELILPAWAGLGLGTVGGCGLSIASGAGGESLLIGSLACAFWGWLYALCQHRTSLLGYLLVGLSYGITLWLVSHLLVHFHAAQAWPLSLEGKVSLSRCLIFTESLALVAILTQILGKSPTTPTVKD